jgi:hypothetical protein
LKRIFTSKEGGIIDMDSIDQKNSQQEVEAELGSSETQNRLLREMNQRMQKLGVQLEQTTIADYIQLLNSPRRLIITNLIAGISRGVGIALGFTLIASTIIYVLTWIGGMNLPWISEFIKTIVIQVQDELKLH